jgi:hypothetical protein
MAKAKKKAAAAADQPLFGEGELAPMPGKIEQQAFDIYNEIAAKVGWATANKLSPARQKQLKAAVTEVGSLVEWRTALERGARSTFLTTKFRPDLEFVCRKPKIIKMWEGGYDDPGSGPKTLAQQMAPADPWASWLRDYRPGGFWPSNLGPRPEDHNCRAPKDMLEACRRRLGIVVAAPQRESEVERLTAMIVSQRKYGFWDRANLNEERLAKLENRPPVLVPAPDVAHLGMDVGKTLPLADVEKSGISRPSGRDRAGMGKTGPPVTDVVDDYAEIPEGELYGEE